MTVLPALITADAAPRRWQRVPTHALPRGHPRGRGSRWISPRSQVGDVREAAVPRPQVRPGRGGRGDRQPLDGVRGQRRQRGQGAAPREPPLPHRLLQEGGAGECGEPPEPPGALPAEVREAERRCPRRITAPPRSACSPRRTAKAPGSGSAARPRTPAAGDRRWLPPPSSSTRACEQRGGRPGGLQHGAEQAVMHSPCSTGGWFTPSLSLMMIPTFWSRAGTPI